MKLFAVIPFAVGLALQPGSSDNGDEGMDAVVVEQSMPDDLALEGDAAAQGTLAECFAEYLVCSRECPWDITFKTCLAECRAEFSECLAE